MRKFLKKSLFLLIAPLLLFLLFGCDQKPRGEYLSENVRYHFTDETVIDGNGYSSLRLFLDDDNSYIGLNSDGSMKIRLILSELAIDVLNALDLASLAESADITDFLDKYIYRMLPGSSPDDLVYTLELFRKSIGIGFVGLNFDDEGIRSLLGALNGGPAPAGVTLPYGLGVEYNGPYYIKTVHSEYSGDHRGVFVGKHGEDGEPFLIMTLEEKAAEGKEILHFRIEVANVIVYAERLL